MVQLTHTGLELDAAIREFKGRYANVSGTTATPSKVLAGYKYVGANKVMRTGTYVPPQLFPPFLQISGSLLLISGNPDNGAFAQYYDIYANAVKVASVAANVESVNLASYGLGVGDTVTVKTRAAGFTDSAASAPVAYNTYSVTYNLVGCRRKYAIDAVSPLGAFSNEIVVESSSYGMTGADVTITMGGGTITGTAYHQISSGAGGVDIDQVSGNVVITITARRLD